MPGLVTARKVTGVLPVGVLWLRVGALGRPPAGQTYPAGAGLGAGRDFRHCAFAAGNAVGAGDVPAAGNRPHPLRQTKVRIYQTLSRSVGRTWGCTLKGPAGG
jgi:hypothetical protein